MANEPGPARQYETLCNVLDSLCEEAPSSSKAYHPSPSNPESLLKARSLAILHLFLKARFGLITFEDRDFRVTDGPFDGGIDAYFIDRSEKKTYILQSKFRATHENFKHKDMSADDILKMDVKRILQGYKENEFGKSYNIRIKDHLQRDMRKIKDIGDYETCVVFLGNNRKLTPSQMKRLVEGYEVDQYPHTRIFEELLFPVVSGTYFNAPDLTVDLEINSTSGASHLTYEVAAHKLKPTVKLLFVPTREIGRIMHTYKNSILKSNPRSYLGLSRNDVNKEIDRSLRTGTGNEFALLNNGITIIADSAKISSDTAKRGTAQLVIRNPQLINGGQTAYTFASIFETCRSKDSFKVFKGKEVLLRVITLNSSNLAKAKRDKERLVGEVSKASNSQNKVDDSDRRSNDPLQIHLQEEFFKKYGLYYERKKGEFYDGTQHGYLSKDLIVRRDKLARVSLACEMRANLARSIGINKFFQDSDLLSVMKVENTAKYAYAYEILRILERLRKTHRKKSRDRYQTSKFGQALRYGQYAVVAVCANGGLESRAPGEQVAKRILCQWKAFENWLVKRRQNKVYRTGQSFDFANYYKGGTINEDLETYTFSF